MSFAPPKSFSSKGFQPLPGHCSAAGSGCGESLQRFRLSEWNHKIFGVGRDLWRSPSPPPGSAGVGETPSGFGITPEREIPGQEGLSVSKGKFPEFPCSEQPVPGRHHPHSEISAPHFYLLRNFLFFPLFRGKAFPCFSDSLVLHFPTYFRAAGGVWWERSSQSRSGGGGAALCSVERFGLY